MKLNRDELAAALVTGCAFLASAQHIYEVSKNMGNPEIISAAHAVGIDGLIYVSLRALADRQWKVGIPGLIWGAGISLTFQAVSYRAFGMPALVMAATMPVSFILAAVSVHGKVRAEDINIDEDKIGHEDTVDMSAGHEDTKDKIIVPDVSTPKTRSLSWDMSDAVRLIVSGDMSTEDIASKIGTSPKTVQRVRRVLSAGGQVAGVSPAFVSSVLAARDHLQS